MNEFKDSINSQSQYLWLILGRKNSPLTEDFSYYYDRLLAYCKVYAKMYVFIGHDKDVDDDGEIKFRHIHALIVLKDGLKPRLSTSLNRIAEATGLSAVDIDIEIAKSIPSCIRYCIHKGYPNKFQYPLEELVHNLNNEDLNAFLNTEQDCVTSSYLITLVELHNCSYIGVMKALGIKSYMKYRGAIKDIIEELKEDI